MNTIVIEHADNKTASLFKELSKRLGLKAKVKAEKEAVIKNPEIISAIEQYENDKKNGNLANYKSFGSIDELKNELNNMLSDGIKIQ